MLIKPENGLYLTRNDSKEYHDVFTNRYNNVYSQAVNSCSECKGVSIMPSITFVVTERCNLACSYCYQCNKTNTTMIKQIAKDAVDFILSDKIKNYFPDAVGYTIEFFGGEPLLNIDVVQYITDYYNEKAFETNLEFLQNTMFSMTSNGILYNTPKVQDYINSNKKLSLGITIDGNKELHDSCRVFPDGSGSYDIVSTAMKDWMKKSYTTNNTKVTIAHDNIDYIYESFVHLWEEIGVQIIHSNCVFEDVWQEGDDQKLYNQLIKVADYLIAEERYKKYYTSFFDETCGQEEFKLDENSCGGNGRMLAIAPNGDLYPCVRFMDYSLNKQPGRCIGNIYDGININDPWLEDLKKVTLRTQSDEECLNCKVASGCAICTGMNYDEFGTPNKRAKYICKMHKARVCANEYFWNKLYQTIGLNKVFNTNIENIYKR